jgi:hypothetical protein
MTDTIDLRYLVESQPSLCIPRVFNNINEIRIRQVFDELKLGSINHIDIVERKSEKGDSFKRVYVHFNKWFWNEDAQAARRKLISGKEIKIVYDNPWFWKVAANKWAPANTNTNTNNKEKREEGNNRPKPHIEFDDDDITPRQKRVNEPDELNNYIKKRPEQKRPEQKRPEQKRPDNSREEPVVIKQEPLVTKKEEPVVYQSTFQQMPQLPPPKKRILLKKKEPVIKVKEENSVVLEEVVETV